MLCFCLHVEAREDDVTLRAEQTSQESLKGEGKGQVLKQQ